MSTYRFFYSWARVYFQDIEADSFEEACEKVREFPMEDWNEGNYEAYSCDERAAEIDEDGCEIEDFEWHE